MHTAHKVCGAGEWTAVEGNPTTDTKCTACSEGRFRADAPQLKTLETEGDVCKIHNTCKAGEWTSAVGTRVTDTTCTPCATGTARATAPSGNAVVETASSCTACAEKSMYSDVVGLVQCKKCPDGHFGVLAAGSTAEGGHKACDDDTCERPPTLPAKSIVVLSKCPEHGKHTAEDTATCTLSCQAGFYSSATNTPFTCLPDAKSTTASYQGGGITCTGGCAGMFGV